MEGKKCHAALMGDTTTQSADDPAGQPADHLDDQSADDPVDDPKGQLGDQANGHPGNLPAGHPSNRKKRHVSTWVAVASAVAAILAAVIAALQVDVGRSQVNAANTQNIETQQEELATLAAQIGGLFEQEQTGTNQATGALTRPPAQSAAEASTLNAAIAQLTVDGQAGGALIHSLHNKGIVGIEDIEIARALAYAGDNSDAVVYYKDAVNAIPHSPTTSGTALQYMAVIYYTNRQFSVAHRQLTLAAKVFKGQRLEPPDYVVNNVAEAYLVDASYQVTVSCRVAFADLQLTHQALGGYQPNTVVGTLLAQDASAYDSKCKAS
jgi:outer membrane murein-binding lipoprotein Lpp